jgi:hypothetical protein
MLIQAMFLFQNLNSTAEKSDYFSLKASWRYSTLQVYQQSCSQVGHIPPKMSDKCPTNLRVNTLSSPTTIWLDIVVVDGRESGYLKIFFTFFEVNMSNILWSMRICKHTLKFPSWLRETDNRILHVCRLSHCYL